MGIFDFLKKTDSKPQSKETSTSTGQNTQSMTQIKTDTTPDTPQPFGFKSAWLAIKGATPQSVIETLPVSNATVSNWRNGLAYAYNDQDAQVFVTPELDGYVLVIGLWDLTLEQLESLAQQFEEVQYFMTHRVVDLQGWTLFQKGNLVRHYYYVGASGEVDSKGELTPQEIELGLDTLIMSEEQYNEASEYDFPDEFNVIEIAAAWGVDPSMESHREEKSTGFVGTVLGQSQSHK